MGAAESMPNLANGICAQHEHQRPIGSISVADTCTPFTPSASDPLPLAAKRTEVSSTSASSPSPSPSPRRKHSIRHKRREGSCGHKSPIESSARSRHSRSPTNRRSRSNKRQVTEFQKSVLSDPLPLPTLLTNGRQSACVATKDGETVQSLFSSRLLPQKLATVSAEVHHGEGVDDAVPFKTVTSETSESLMSTAIQSTPIGADHESDSCSTISAESLTKLAVLLQDAVAVSRDGSRRGTPGTFRVLDTLCRAPLRRSTPYFEMDDIDSDAEDSEPEVGIEAELPNMALLQKHSPACR